MSRPIIGITVVPLKDESDRRTGGSLTLNWNYADAVSRAGGNPILLPPQASVDELAGILDGILIPGGKDIDPSLYGDAIHAKAVLESGDRFDLERRLFEGLPPNLPFLGICYGCQLLSVLRGGKLAQHLPDTLGHDLHSHGELQKYTTVPETRLASLVGPSASGQSWHHQAVESVGADLVVAARASDGTIEALEATDRAWTFGVQWHPERTPENDSTRQLMAAFVGAASEYRTQRTSGAHW